jgi:hypothetical protein
VGLLAGAVAGGRREMSRGRSPEPLDFFIWTVEVLISSVRWFSYSVSTLTQMLIFFGVKVSVFWFVHSAAVFLLTIQSF